MAGTVLLTLGRLPKGLDIARAFDAQGWRVLLAEPFDWNLCALSRAVAKSYAVPAPNEDPQGYRDALLGIVRREHVDLIVPVSEETVHVAGLRDGLPAHCSMFCPRQADLLVLHDKLSFAHLVADAGLTAPQTSAIDGDNAAAIAQETDYLVKDRFGASGSNITFHEAGEPLPLDRPDALVQERLKGREVSTFSIAHAGKTVCTIVYEPVIRDGTVATVFRRIGTDDPAERAVSDVAKAIAAHTGHTGFLSFDMMVTANGQAVPFECNPRANSGIHFLELASIFKGIRDPKANAELRTNAHLQQAYPTLTLLWGAIGKWPRYRQIGKAMFSARDVTWSWRDPLPFILMTPATWPLLRQTIFEGRSLGEAAIRDIGWFGPPTAPTS